MACGKSMGIVWAWKSIKRAIEYIYIFIYYIYIYVCIIYADIHMRIYIYIYMGMSQNEECGPGSLTRGYDSWV